MSRAKQIAEMAQAIRKEVWADGETCRKDCDGCDCFDYRKAEILYNAGFRKQSDTPTNTPTQNQFTNRDYLSKLDSPSLVQWILFDAPEIGRMSTNSPLFLAEWLDREYDGWINLREYSEVMIPRMKGGAE